jgi:hypothetical protein
VIFKIQRSNFDTLGNCRIELPRTEILLKFEGIQILGLLLESLKLSENDYISENIKLIFKNEK